MFEDNIFEKWLDEKTKEIVLKMGNGQALTSDEMIILVLKAQTNHFVHLDQDLRTEMINVGNKITKVDQDLRSDMQDMNARLSQEMKDLRTDMDKRFEQVDKRFETLTTRIDRFMIWSFATTITVGGIVIASIKFIQ